MSKFKQFIEYLKEYCDATTVHGLKYLSADGRPNLEK